MKPLTTTERRLWLLILFPILVAAWVCNSIG